MQQLAQQGHSVGQALDAGVHEAGVAQIAQTGQAAVSPAELQGRQAELSEAA